MQRDDWNARYASAELVWSAEPNRFLVDEVADLQAGKALDLACGEGRNAIWLAGLGWRVTAIDFADVAIDKGRRIAERLGAEVDWIVGDVTEYQPEQDRFDLVIVFYLHTKERDRRVWMQRARDALRPGGLFLYVGHDRSNIEHGVGGPRSPEVLTTPREIAALLPGFDIEKAQIVERPVAADPGHGKAEGIALDTLVRARKTPTWATCNMGDGGVTIQ